jgi:peptidylprolyl isomerase
MSTAQNGNTVKVDYVGTLLDGTEFDRSPKGDPLEFTLGEQQMIAGFEGAVLGMRVGETKKVTIPAAEAYGEHDAELLSTVERSALPADLAPTVGMKLRAMTGSGAPVVVCVSEVTDTTVTLDANHELAGKSLVFEITVVSIQ